MPVLLVEGLRGRKALGRSFQLVKGRWWRTFGVIVVGFLLAGIVSAIVQGAFLIGIIFEPDNDAARAGPQRDRRGSSGWRSPRRFRPRC